MGMGHSNTPMSERRELRGNGGIALDQRHVERPVCACFVYTVRTRVQLSGKDERFFLLGRTFVIGWRNHVTAYWNWMLPRPSYYCCARSSVTDWTIDTIHHDDICVIYSNLINRRVVTWNFTLYLHIYYFFLPFYCDWKEFDREWRQSSFKLQSNTCDLSWINPYL